MKQRAVFIDKDGTLVEDVPFNVAIERIRIANGAEEALRELAAEGFRLIVITNQPGVALGYYPLSAVDAVWEFLRRHFERVGAPLTGFYACPHDPHGRVPEYAISCECRKPAAGLLRRAAIEHHLDLSRSWFIGDILHDVEAGRRAGCRTVLLNNGHEREWQLNRLRTPDFIVPDLLAAARQIRQAEVLR
jgi:D-glycero-D-manno-heptose 1,7-bisphosphate phosphatase